VGSDVIKDGCRFLLDSFLEGDDVSILFNFDWKDMVIVVLAYIAEKSEHRGIRTVEERDVRLENQYTRVKREI
jgi:hypothetical protein